MCGLCLAFFSFYELDIEGGKTTNEVNLLLFFFFEVNLLVIPTKDTFGIRSG